jgi:hypothetical protein
MWGCQIQIQGFYKSCLLLVAGLTSFLAASLVLQSLTAFLFEPELEEKHEFLRYADNIINGCNL